MTYKIRALTKRHLLVQIINIKINECLSWYEIFYLQERNLSQKDQQSSTSYKAFERWSPYLPQIGHIVLPILQHKNRRSFFFLFLMGWELNPETLFRGKECKTSSKEAKKAINERRSRNQAKRKKVQWPQNGKLF